MTLDLYELVALDRVIVEANELACAGDAPYLATAVDHARQVYDALLDEYASATGSSSALVHARVRQETARYARLDGFTEDYAP